MKILIFFELLNTAGDTAASACHTAVSGHAAAAAARIACTAIIGCCGGIRGEGAVAILDGGIRGSLRCHGGGHGGCLGGGGRGCHWHGGGDGCGRFGITAAAACHHTKGKDQQRHENHCFFHMMYLH